MQHRELAGEVLKLLDARKCLKHNGFFGASLGECRAGCDGMASGEALSEAGEIAGNRPGRTQED